MRSETVPELLNCWYKTRSLTESCSTHLRTEPPAHFVWFCVSKNLIFKHAGVSGLCRCKDTLKTRLGLVVGFPFICYFVINTMKMLWDPPPMKTSGVLPLTPPQDLFPFTVCTVWGELQGWLRVTATISVWGMERRACLWMNLALQGSLKGSHNLPWVQTPAHCVGLNNPHLSIPPAPVLML